MAVEIVEATAENRIGDVRALFLEYHRQLGVDLCFQDFERELAGLPGDYAPPAGRLLLALVDEAPAGCIALRPLPGKACEMKRLYVRPAFQGSGLGRALAEKIIGLARDAGYDEMFLDTLPSMQSAQRLYERLGFRDTDPYRINPVVGSRFMALRLEARA